MRALVLCLWASTATAETVIGPAEFETWSEGQTLDYFDGETYWGSEQHGAGRVTLDASPGGECHRGTWSAEGDAICFSYDISPGPHCWRFVRDGDAVFAQNLDVPDLPRYRVERRAGPLSCPGPDVGV